MDWARVRAEFPILERTFQGRPLVYLDSAATSQKPKAVIEATADYYTRLNANVHRGAYQLSEEATEAYEASRVRLAKMIHAHDPSEVIFLRGATEGVNVVAAGLARSWLARGDRVLTTVMEHHSNIVPWQLLRTYSGLELDYIDIDAAGRLDLADLDRKLEKKPRLVPLTHVSNVLGTVNPVRQIADRAHAAGALVLVDAAQSIPHRSVDVGALGADFLVFSGHKMLGPTGIGVLWARREILDRMPPALGGGEMIREVHQDRVAFREPPAKFEAGTPNIAGAVGLSVAADFLEGLGWEAIRAREEQFLKEIYRRASEEPFRSHMRIFGPPPGPDREAVVSFSLAGVHPHDVSSILDAEGIAIRSGQHCAGPLMDRLGVSALSRASPYVYNTPEEIDRLFAALEKVVKVFADPARTPAKVAG